MVNRNLFLYDLAVVAIFKDEGKYLREWLDYHLIAGVNHFYLYNNDSSDDYKEILTPYIEANLVTLINSPGPLMMYPAYDDAIEKYRFDCRYMAFIDIDEFIYPKSNRSIVEVVDEILFADSSAAALGINWQIFGSNGQKTADYSQGVLERFTRRAPSDWVFILSEDKMIGNVTIKSIVNPRRVDCWWSPHYASYFHDFYSINSNGARTVNIVGYPVAADKIVINHYQTKSREEYENKIKRGSPCRTVNARSMELFQLNDRNDEFDDGILKFRAACAQNFTLESDLERIRRVEKILIETLTLCSPLEAPAEFFIGKLETFLTCRHLAEKLETKLGNKTAEEYSLVWIYQMINKDGVLTYAELQLLLNALPEILARPFPLAKGIGQVFATKILPAMSDAAKNFKTYKDYKNLLLLKRLLNSI